MSTIAESPSEGINPTARLLQAGKRYLAAEQAFEKAKRDFNQACDEYHREGESDATLPRYVWDNGSLFKVIYEGAKPPKFHQIPSYDVAVAPAAG